MLRQPGLLTFVNQLKGARGVTIISTAISGDLMKSAGTQMRIERTLRRQRDEQGIHGFTQVVRVRVRASARARARVRARVRVRGRRSATRLPMAKATRSAAAAALIG